MRRCRPSDHPFAHRRPDERSQGCSDDLSGIAGCGHANRRQGIRQRRLPRRSIRARDCAVHPTARQAQIARNVLQSHVQTAPQGREHVRQTQGLETYLNALRPMRTHILQRNLHRCDRHLLAGSMSPDPRLLIFFRRQSEINRLAASKRNAGLVSLPMHYSFKLLISTGGSNAYPASG